MVIVIFNEVRAWTGLNNGSWPDGLLAMFINSSYYYRIDVFGLTQYFTKNQWQKNRLRFSS